MQCCVWCSDTDHCLLVLHMMTPNTRHGLPPCLAPQGHAIECRINAEDPFANFRPGPGRVTTYLPPGGPNVRMDSHLYPGYLVPPNYDSLLGKLIVWGVDRQQAINRMQRALDEMVIGGVVTTIGYHKLLLACEDFQKGIVDTGFIVKHAAGEPRKGVVGPKGCGAEGGCWGFGAEALLMRLVGLRGVGG